MVSTPREQLLSAIKSLDDEQIEELLVFVQLMQSSELANDYDPANDPLVGFFSAEADFASRTREILDNGFGQSFTTDDK